MKLAFALFLLGGCVFLSEQQRFPFQYQSRVVPPWAYLDAFSDNDLYSYMLARRFGFPINPSFLPQQNAYLGNNEPIVVQNTPSDKAEEQTADIQSRNKNGGLAPVIPFQPEVPANPRFLLNFVTTIGSSNTIYNPLQKTIYYFTTTTATTTFTTTCITSTAFTSSSYTLICRKRRELMEFLSALDKTNDEPEKPAEVSPSVVQQVEPTADPSTGLEQFQLSSSKDEETLSNEDSDAAGGDISTRAKRLFISTTIVTTYVFSTITTTRTLSTNFVGSTSLSCRPSQFTYC